MLCGVGVLSVFGLMSCGVLFCKRIKPFRRDNNHPTE